MARGASGARAGTARTQRRGGIGTTAGTMRAGSSTASIFSPNMYTYGHGTGTRQYRAYGYGSGYRNRYHGGRGYGRSQGNNRVIVGRLRSVHASLARLDHDYKGHRVRSMHAIAMAIRQLSHGARSRGYQGLASSIRRTNGLAMNGGRAGAGGRGNGMRMSQAQSDARMSQALRNLQGIHMQLASQGRYSTGHARARGHVQRAMHELNTALAVR